MAGLAEILRLRSWVMACCSSAAPPPHCARSTCARPAGRWGGCRHQQQRVEAAQPDPCPAAALLRHLPGVAASQPGAGCWGARAPAVLQLCCATGWALAGKGPAAGGCSCSVPNKTAASRRAGRVLRWPGSAHAASSAAANRARHDTQQAPPRQLPPTLRESGSSGTAKPGLAPVPCCAAAACCSRSACSFCASSGSTTLLGGEGGGGGGEGVGLGGNKACVSQPG
jgi:hypothetical protein